MPLTRYNLRNEYSLADPELYTAADKDDPEALLEGVAMAGLVGVLRQLGDLAEFAAEIFRDLHEEVMATAARGHGLMIRVQQIEAACPSIEKAFLSQTSHSLFFLSAGVEWHPNMCTEHNLITRGDLPHFVLDSYEECRGPPRLFLLDKFDVAGTGACLKRYTDPSFFKVESGFSGLASVEVHKEKIIRKVKNKGSPWRNGETTPEIGPTSHTKLQQLFLEERVKDGFTDPSRLVKLKKRQLNDCPFDSKNRKSYMNKFLETTPENKVVHEVCVTPPPLGLTSVNKSKLGLAIIEIDKVSPDRVSAKEKQNPCLSPDIKEVVLKPSTNELSEKGIDGETLNHPEPASDDEFSDHHFNLSTDYMTNEVENYMDALTTVESERETDNDSKSKNSMRSEMEIDNEFGYKNDVGFFNVEKHGMYYDANEEQTQLPAQVSDSQLIGNSFVSDDGNICFRNYRSSLSHSSTVSNVDEDVPCDGGHTAELSFSTETCVPELVDIPSDQLSGSAQLPGKESGDFERNGSIEEDNMLSLGNEPCSSSLTGSNLLPLDSGVSLLEASSLGPQLAEASPFNELDNGGPCHVSASLHHHSNGYDLALEKGSGSPVNLQTEYEDQSCAQIFVTRENGSHSKDKLLLAVLGKDLPGITSPRDSLPSSPLCNEDSVDPYGNPTEFDDAVPEVGINLENSTPRVCTRSLGILEFQFSGTTNNVLQLELDTLNAHVSNTEEKKNLKEIPMTADYGKSGAFVSIAGSEDDPILSNYSIGMDHVDHVTLEGVVSETVQEKDLVMSATTDPDEDFTVISSFLDLSESSSSNLVNLQDQDPHHKGLESVSEHADSLLEQHDATHVESFHEQSQNSFQVSDFLTALTSSGPRNQESESINGLAENAGNCLPSPTTHLLQPDRPEPLQAGETIFKAPDLQFEQIQNPSHIIREVEASKSCPELTEEPSESVSLSPSACLELAGTVQTIYPSDIVYPSFIVPVETQFNHSSECWSRDLYTESSFSKILPQSTELQVGGSKETSVSFDPVLPSFSLHSGMAKVNLDEMPPLPPLPPMQWRLLRAQQAPLALQRVVECNHESLQSTQPSIAGNTRNDFAASERGHESLEDELKFSSQCSLAMPMQFSLQLQSKGNDTNGQHDRSCLEETKSPNPFSLLPAMSNAMPEYGVHRVGIEMIMSSSNPFEPAPTISDTTSRVDLVSSDIKIIQPHQVALETGSEANKLQHTTQGLEEKEGNPLESVVPQPTYEAPTLLDTILHTHIVSSERKLIEPLGAPDTGSKAKMLQHTTHGLEDQQGDPIETFVPPPTYVDNQPKDSLLLSSVGKMSCLSNTSPLLPVSEVGEPNENPASENPHLRSPLIEAVAAHDKSSLRRVTERLRPQIAPKVEEKDSFLEQIRMKSFHLKPASVARPSIQGPKTNLMVAAILEKANAIRQAFAGSDEDDDTDSWSE